MLAFDIVLAQHFIASNIIIKNKNLLNAKVVKRVELLEGEV